MNIIMDKTCSTTKVNPTKWHIFSNLPKYLPAKISSYMVCLNSEPPFLLTMYAYYITIIIIIIIIIITIHLYL